MEGAEAAAGDGAVEPAPPAGAVMLPPAAWQGAAASAPPGAAASASSGAAAASPVKGAAGSASTGSGSPALKLIADGMGEDDDIFGARAAAASSGNTKGPKKRKERKGHMTCVGCLSSKLVTDFDLSQKVCKECKRHLDRIAGQCKRQGQMDWFSDQRRDPKKLVAMLSFYKKIMDACSSHEKPKFNIACYQETHAAEQSVSYSGEGEMMWQEQALNV
jgi:hypothetical protein